jgi:hypothetical protein
VGGDLISAPVTQVCWPPDIILGYKFAVRFRV